MSAESYELFPSVVYSTVTEKNPKREVSLVVGGREEVHLLLEEREAKRESLSPRKCCSISSVAIVNRMHS